MSRLTTEWLEDSKKKRKWMEEHGYNLLAGIYDIQIIIGNHPQNANENVVHKAMISADKVKNMTMGELELYDKNVWSHARNQINELIKATKANRGEG